jgi:hypothetical protein
MSDGEIWTRNLTQAFKEELPQRSIDLVDKLARNPGYRFTIRELIESMDIEDEELFKYLLGTSISAAHRAGLPHLDEHSWFILWESIPEFRFWLNQQRSDWWLGLPDRSYWAFLSNPSIYRIEDAVREIEQDWWTSKGRGVEVGDRVIIWKSLGGSDRRGIIALGEIIGAPEDRKSEPDSYWVDPEQGEIVEERCLIRYKSAPKLPLWVGMDHDDLLMDLSIARATGGTVFKITPSQWECILLAAGGWPED